jgi:hypothetical protein
LVVPANRANAAAPTGRRSGRRAGPPPAPTGFQKGGPVTRAVGGASRPARPGECGT